MFGSWKQSKTMRSDRAIFHLLVFCFTVAAFTFVPPALANSSTKTYNVAKFGAKGDGVALETAFLQHAIDAAAKTGGIVVFNPGTYLTGAIFVKSGVTLNVGKGVTLIGSQSLADYPLMPTRIAGIEMTWPSALINVYEQTGATITEDLTVAVYRPLSSSGGTSLLVYVD